MKISEITANQGKIDITAEVISVEEPREFEKFGKKLKVGNAIIKDDSGEIKMTLWNEDTEKVKQGMNIHIINGYASEFKGEKQVTTGKFGELEILNQEQKETATTPEETNSEPEENLI